MMPLQSLVLKLPTSRHSVMFTKSPKHTQVKKEKLTTYMRSRAHLKSSQRYAYCQCQVEQADCENMLLQAPRGLALLT